MFIEYWMAENHMYLNIYGFVPRKNPFDKYFVDLKADHCNEFVSETGKCRWKLKTYELN